VIKLARYTFALALGSCSFATTAIDVAGIRMWPAPDKTRVVFDVDGPPDYRVFQIQGPNRVVLDIERSRYTEVLRSSNLRGGVLQGIRAGDRGNGQVRVVLDVTRPVTVKSFVLGPNERYGHRLVVDLFDDRSPPLAAPPTIADRGPQRDRDIVVAIDPGHGGEDPGASGASGLQEKHVALAIARRLAAMIEREPGMRPVLIRNGDYYVGLRQRIVKANQAQADLFISIHADAFRDKRVNGASVYVLSERGASSEAARWLANQENASDRIGGVSLEDKDDVLRSVLLDLSQTASMEASSQVAAKVLNRLGGIGRVHRHNVQSAGFVVLKSPDIPSILIETAFISNPQDERRLREINHQQRLAQAIMVGVRDYFSTYPPAGTWLASRSHTIAHGETLTSIADAYDVSTDKLRLENDLRSDQLRAGDVLRIP
jgi:N-acetylmuramoyl-L-alanine amidase